MPTTFTIGCIDDRLMLATISALQFSRRRGRFDQSMATKGSEMVLMK
ncbi:hypothetical protein [Aporhodopirellula rubra]|nr:hypothetical protein [Aporhodopirellula rubra]